jgi:hypothetical protein
MLMLLKDSHFQRHAGGVGQSGDGALHHRWRTLQGEGNGRLSISTDLEANSCEVGYTHYFTIRAGMTPKLTGIICLHKT